MSNTTQTFARRCAACGTMGAETDFELNQVHVVLDGVRHSLPLCRGNGACEHNGELLASRLSFREVE
jgi:hypothetical protein